MSASASLHSVRITAGWMVRAREEGGQETADAGIETRPAAARRAPPPRTGSTSHPPRISHGGGERHDGGGDGW